ncbi:MAG TPA: tetratricopeptide repeat protein [Acidobacteriaceae bacterium]|nr:tetratricopeptide repeat protein [Acidobacteriaceae bacterium]
MISSPMFFIRPRFGLLLLIGLTASALCPPASARDLRITIPRHSKLTPVQRLNREGVGAIRKRDYEKAESIFYKAYLYDPADPFTLNNLGYISELRGNLESADRFYRLAAEQSCGAIIDISTDKQLRGKPMMDAVDTVRNLPMRINLGNVQAILLLEQDRPFEAEALLKHLLPSDPQNPYTLNNLGVTEETLGDFDAALRYYDDAAAVGSKEPIVVSLDRKWRGRPVSQAAADAAATLRRRMRTMDLSLARARMLTLRGVSAANQNDWEAARTDFLDAYRLDPGSAFSLNNRGYVAERAGDLESAQFYYAQARRAGDSGTRVGLATRPTAEGQPLTVVASESNDQVDTALGAYTQNRRGQPGPVVLIPRNGQSLTPPAQQHPNQNNNQNDNPQE